MISYSNFAESYITGDMPMANVGLLMVILTTFLGCTRTSEPSTRTNTEHNREIVRQAFEKWRDGTGNPFDLLVPEAEWTIVGSSPMSKTYQSRQKFLDEVIVPFNARVQKPLMPSVHGIYADDETVIIFFDGETIANDGVAYRNTYTWYFEMKNSRVVKATAFFDTRIFDDLWNRVIPTS